MVTTFQVNKTANRKLTAKGQPAMLAMRTSANSCPDTCEHKINRTCYAMFGHEGMAWKKLNDGTSKRGGDWLDLCDQLRDLKPAPGTMIRVNTAGDLPHHGGRIDRTVVGLLADSFRFHALKPYGYTHHVHSESNLETVKEQNQSGWTINLSCNSEAQASEMTRQGFASVCVAATDDERKHWTDEHGVKFVACPQQYRDSVTCQACKLCAKPLEAQQASEGFRRCVVVFKAHGARKKALSQWIVDSVTA